MSRAAINITVTCDATGYLRSLAEFKAWFIPKLLATIAEIEEEEVYGEFRADGWLGDPDAWKGDSPSA